MIGSATNDEGWIDLINAWVNLTILFFILFIEAEGCKVLGTRDHSF